jgi:hypothetical protein
VEGRAQYSGLNQAVDELNSALEEKYTFLAKPISSYTGFFTFVLPPKSEATI